MCYIITNGTIFLTNRNKLIPETEFTESACCWKKELGAKNFLKNTKKIKKKIVLPNDIVVKKITETMKNQLINKNIKAFSNTETKENISTETKENISFFNDENLDIISDSKINEEVNQNTIYYSLINDFIIKLNELTEKKEILKSLLSELDKCENDLVHYAEFNNLNAVEGYKYYKTMHDLRIDRRKIKDEYYEICTILDNLGNTKEQLYNIIHKIEDHYVRDYKIKCIGGFDKIHNKLENLH